MAENIIKSNEFFFYCYVFFFKVPFGGEAAQRMPPLNCR